MNNDWSNNIDIDLEMSIENIEFILRNNKKHGYHNMIISGFNRDRIHSDFKDEKYIIIILYLTDEEKLKKRVLDPTRDSGFRDFEESISLNRKIITQSTLPNEYKVDNTTDNSEETANQIMEIVDL
jgi:hypothetical protein